MSTGPVSWRRAVKQLLGLAALGVLGACAAGTGTDASTQPGTPAKVISDGNHINADNDLSGNRDFFFLPPLVPNPRNSPNWSKGQFNANLQPTAKVCELAPPQGAAATENDITPATPCKTVSGNEVFVSTFPFGTTGDVVKLDRPYNGDSDDDANDDNDDGGHYHFKWKVPVADAVFYRVRIYVGTKIIGYADVETRNSGKDLKNIDTDEFVARKDGSTAQIKFRIENRALCTPAGDYSVPCATATVNLTTGGTVSTTTVTGSPIGIVIPPQLPSSGPTATYTVQPCAAANISVDIPTFGSCVSIVSSDPSSSLTVPATAFVCDLAPSLGGTVNSAQRETVALHGQHTSFTEALVEAPAPCPVLGGLHSSVKDVFASVWRGQWRVAGHHLANLIQPQPLMASFIHVGGGGQTLLQSDFQLALPCKMEIQAGDGVSTTPGSTITATALVTDLFGQPCRNAKVHWVGSNISAAPGYPILAGGVVLSDLAGLSSVNWTLPSAASFTITASGFGLATAAVNGPRVDGVESSDFVPHPGVGSPAGYPAQSFDPFIPKYLSFGPGLPDAQAASTSGIPLQQGTLTFHAAAAYAPVNVFDYRSGGYSYITDVVFDGSNNRTGGFTGGSAAAPSNWWNTAFAGTPGSAPFGSTGSCGISALPSGAPAVQWAVGTDIIVQKSFTTPYPGTLTLTVRLDNDAQVYLDGANITDKAIATEGFGGFNANGWWQHDNCADNGKPVFVVPGVIAGGHRLAIRGHDYGGDTWLDVKADLAP